MKILGNFGYVRSGTFTFNSGTAKIAIKKLKNKSDKKGMLKEIHMLSTCKHENIVTFLGFIEQEESADLCIITELMAGGDLRTYLRNPDMPLTVDKVFLYIFQVVEGMTYLCRKHILHRDLAARNCLLDKKYELILVYQKKWI
uniref:Protein kinase domain-containing protein n=1 Tax=Panagrolaimus sp. ES5 TaxID=591445 RepID=A0AC34GN71_9BILA